MTVPSTYTPTVVAANGVTTSFPFSFPVLAASHLRVELNGVALTNITDYTVTGVGNPAGGTAELLVAPTSGVIVTLQRAMPVSRETDFQQNGDLLADTLNDDQDAPVMMLQQVNEKVGRALQLPLGSAASALLPAVQAGYFIRAKLDGTGFEFTEGTGTLPGEFIQSGTGAVGRSYDAKIGEVVSVKDFGALGDGLADDTAAFEAALAAARRVFVPASATPYRVDDMTIPSGRVLYGEGAGSVIAPFTVGAGDVITLANGATDIHVFDLTFDVDPATYAAKEVIGGTNNTRVTLRDLRFDGGGAYAINLSNQQQTIIQRVRVDGVSQSGILLFTADQCQVNDCVIQMQSGALAGVDIYFGTLCKISGCNVENAGVFGYHLVDSDYCSIVDNTSWNTDREGINLQNSSNNTVVGNTVAWDGTTSIDFGISVYAETSAADSNLISGNTIVNPFKSGITIDGSLFSASGTLISGNKIYDCNIEDAVSGAGVLLFGANVSRTHVIGNLAEDTIGKLRYCVNAGGTSTLSTIKNNRAIGALLGVVDQDNGEVALNGEGSRAFVPTVVPGSGAFTTLGAVTFRYYELEKMVFFRASVAITTNGTAATSVVVTLPFVANGTHVVAGRESAVTGLMLQGSIISGTSNCVLTTNDAVYPGGDGRTLIVSGWYERA